MECLEKGLHSVCGSVIQRLGSLALDNGRVIRDIDLDDMQGKPFSLRKRA